MKSGGPYPPGEPRAKGAWSTSMDRTASGVETMTAAIDGVGRSTLTLLCSVAAFGCPLWERMAPQQSSIRLSWTGGAPLFS
jgi:hypothetical protein